MQESLDFVPRPAALQLLSSFLSALADKARAEAAMRRASLAHLNSQRCAAQRPLYGRDLLAAVAVERPAAAAAGPAAQQARRFWRVAGTLAAAVKTNEQRALEAQDLLATFLFAIPKVSPVLSSCQSTRVAVSRQCRAVRFC